MINKINNLQGPYQNHRVNCVGENRAPESGLSRQTPLSTVSSVGAAELGWGTAIANSDLSRTWRVRGVAAGGRSVLVKCFLILLAIISTSAPGVPLAAAAFKDMAAQCVQ